MTTFLCFFGHRSVPAGERVDGWGSTGRAPSPRWGRGSGTAAARESHCSVYREITGMTEGAEDGAGGRRATFAWTVRVNEIGGNGGRSGCACSTSPERKRRVLCPVACAPGW